MSEWSPKPLSAFAAPEINSFVDGPFGSNLKVSDYTENGVRILQLQNLGDGVFIDDNLKFTSHEKAISLSRCIVRQGDIIIAKMAEPLARACIVPSQISHAIIVADLIKLRPRPDVDIRFLCAAINSSAFRREAERLSTGTTRTRITLSTLKTIRLISPGQASQAKIGETLTTIDEAIERTEALIAKNQQIKTGLMYDLFTRGVQPNGQLRPPRDEAPQLYKDSPLGWIPKDWEVSDVASEFDIASGITLGPHRRPAKNPCPYLRVANVYTERLELEDIAFLEASPAELIDKKLTSGDLLIVEGHANPKEIGRCAMATSEVEGFTFQNHLFRLRPRRIIPEFALSWMNGHIVRSYWLRVCSTSSGLNTINRTKLGAVQTIVTSMHEQEKICAVLSIVSQNIALGNEQLGKLRIMKSGLMHDLLTGRVLVPAVQFQKVIANA